MTTAELVAAAWCPVCRVFSPPTRSQAWHEATAIHKANGREPERRVRAGTRAERAPQGWIGDR
jgi:hypothetical protein